MKPQRKAFIFLIIFYIYVFLAGSLPVFAEYRFDSWTTDDGLPQNSVREIAQTPDGYLWFTTFDGVVRFDGVKFTTFSKNNTKGIVNNRFSGIYYSAKDDALYMTTIEGGILTVYKNGVFNSYTSEQVPGHFIDLIRKDKNGEDRFLVIEGDDYSRNWYILRDGKFFLSEVIDKNNPQMEYRGASGATWNLYADRIVENRNGKVNVYPHKTERFNGVRDVFEDRAGALWIGGAKLIRLKDSKIEDLTKSADFPINGDFHSFWEEPDGSLWFANGGKSAPGLGLVRYAEGKFTSFGKESGLSNSSIFSIFRDREGTLWLATNKGLNRFKRQIIKPYSVKDGLRNSEVYPILRDRQDNIWIGTVEGLNIYRNGKFEPVNLRQSDPQANEVTKWRNGEVSVQSLFEDARGKMWIGVNGGLYVIENGATKMFPESAGHHVYAVGDDQNGDVWAATNKGILRYRDYRQIAFYTSADGLPDNFMNLVYRDSQGRLWFGGYGGLTEFKDEKFINYTIAQGLVGNYVRSIYEDADGALWIGTYGEGLSRFKDNQFFNYKEENGLLNGDVFAIREDARGNFWISSNHGIYRVSREQLNALADGKINKVASIGYGKEDGMLNSECNGGRQPASITDKDGKFWFPTQDGVVVVDPERETYNAQPPSVVIESVSVEREPLAVSQNLTIEAEQKNIEINFTGISLIKSAQIKFKYKLEGHDSEWIDAGTRRTAYYSHLPHGNYRFLVKAANSDGVWSGETANLNFEIKPYFYQTDGFYLMSALGALLVLLLVWKISVHQLESRERRLAGLVIKKTEELEKANEELQLLANSDGLTTVGNRRLFEDFLADEWHRAIRFKTEISLVLLDIDHFKLFNDTYGHQAGDECLKKVAAALRETIHRPTDLVARFGGEEFAIVLGGTDLDGALTIARQAMENVKNLAVPHCTSPTGEHLTISIGVATTFVAFGMQESGLIKSADLALYQAKATGRDQIVSKDLTLSFGKIQVLEEKFIGT